MNATDDENPYRTPKAIEPATSEPERDDSSPKYESLGRVLVTWEKLRVIYNVIGAVPTALLAVIFPEALGELVACAVLANLCYCLGPLVDCYLTWFGIRHNGVTGILFVLGTGVMLVLALGAGVSFGPGW